MSLSLLNSTSLLKCSALQPSDCGERGYCASAEERLCCTLALYPEQGRPQRAIAPAVVGISSKPQSQVCLGEQVTTTLLGFPEFPGTSIGLTHEWFFEAS